MSKETRSPSLSDDRLQAIFRHARAFETSLEKLLGEIDDDEDDNFFIAIADARNVVGVLTNRAADKLRLP